jgi:hypothetical protein
MDTAGIAQVDEMDPVVAILTWALMAAARKWALPDRLRPIIPVLAILLATGLVAGLQAFEGEALSLQTVVRGLGAGAAAIAGHSGVRELSKVMVKPSEVEEQPIAPPEESEE